VGCLSLNGMIDLRTRLKLQLPELDTPDERWRAIKKGVADATKTAQRTSLGGGKKPYGKVNLTTVLRSS